MEDLDSDRFVKRILQFERVDDGRSGQHEMDDLHLTMQPPRLPSKNSYHHQLTANPEAPPLISKQWDGSRSATLGTGVLGSTKTSRMDIREAKLPVNSFRENTMTTQYVIPPADEGSRTGLKGSGVVNLINSVAHPTLGSAHPASGSSFSGLPSGRTKSWSQANGSDPTFAGSKQNATTSTRQMTIFYGGQAHVFDDVPPDKAEAIMTLAGSSGRSWSTIYSPRHKGSDTMSQSEGSMQAHNLEREKIGSKSFPRKGLGSHPVSAEVHNAMTVSAYGGSGGSYSGPVKPPEANSGLSGRWCADVQATADLVGSSPSKQESRGRLPPLQSSMSASKARDGL